MAVDLRHWKRLTPGRRNVFECLRLNFPEHVGIDTDIGQAHATATNSPRQQQVRWLAPEECHGLGGADRDPHDGATGAVDTARQVHGMHACARIHGIDQAARRTLDRSVKASSEQRVQDHMCAG